MQSKLTFLLTSIGAAALLVLAMALGPTTIGSTAPREATAVSAHSWVSDAFPTGQAGFARPVDGGR